jgi:hypothetical protein
VIPNSSTIKVEVIMEYRCGHPPVAIASGNVKPHRLRKGLESLTEKAPKRADGMIECRCPKCQRGAGWIVVKANGVTISRSSVDSEARSGQLHGADLSIGPDQENN